MFFLRRFVTFGFQSQNAVRLVHTTPIASVDIRWRRRNKLPEHVRQEPEFMDRPDYSFLDGRPTPIGKVLQRRYEDEKRLAEDAIKYIGELDYALQRQEQIKLEREETAQRILSRKLQPKGPAYEPKQNRGQDQ